MAVFAVVLNGAHPEVAERIEKAYPDFYQLNDTFFLVQKDGIIPAENVAISLGIKGDDRVENADGVVFRLNNAYAGHSARSLWDWLGQAEEKEGA